MITIMGITGQVGSALAGELLAAGQNVRAIVRNTAKAAAWEKKGVELAVADAADAGALTTAFSGSDAVFILLPPNFDPTPGFPESRAIIAALHTALLAARPKRIVCLSTIGAQATQENLLNQLQIMEKAFSDLPMPTAFIRAAWFMENAIWDIDPAVTSGIIPSFLQPLDKAVPMIATADIARHAARLLQEDWNGQRIIELEGARLTPNQIAASFSRLLGKPVQMQVIPRADWKDLFTSQGMSNPLPRMQMLDGFNEGWICFEGGAAEQLTGTTSFEDVIAEKLRSMA
ncbi:NmrA family NAD(P)-binding protein [Undibacterium terreum]|uniref:Nucleoside-diphosphate sugar epimerase n=1 Tax=Undibacterium terreum TaxID=1224302 RepID=A0A916U614_9BURK|nr:NmrA family NAD(P)-binding protein [Undibacterium terreum]GGC60766.1 nucleoside-diphosphate sugar epimerase [Undibacterium terreum]